MSQYDFDILLKKYLEGNCTSREESIVLEWYQNLISESRLELTNEEKQAIENKIWAKVHSGINDYPGKTKKAPVLKFNPKIIYRVTVAACFVLLVGIGWYWFAKSSFRIIYLSRIGFKLFECLGFHLRTNFVLYFCDWF